MRFTVLSVLLAGCSPVPYVVPPVDAPPLGEHRLVPSAFERRARHTPKAFRGERPRVDPVRIDLETLPRSSFRVRPTSPMAPPRARDARAIDLALDESIEDGTVTPIWTGWGSEPIVGDYVHLYQGCHRYPGNLVTASWLGVTYDKPHEELRATLAEGWFSPRVCHGWVDTLTVTRVRSVLPDGSLLAARDCGERCDRDDLLVVFPRPNFIATDGVSATAKFPGFGLARIPIGRHGGGSVVARIFVADLAEWQEMTPGLAEVTADADDVGTMLAGVDVTGEEAIAYSTWVER